MSFKKSGIYPELSTILVIPPLTLILQYMFYVCGKFSVCSVCSLIALSHLRFSFFPLDCKLLKGKVNI
jgi:hypothetical protein